MLCGNCPQRTRCVAPCAALESELAKVTAGQMELPVDPADLECVPTDYESPFAKSEYFDQGLLTALYDSLGLLKAADRRLLYQVYWLGHDMPRLAKQMGLNIKTVRRHIARAHSRLRSKLERKGFDRFRTQAEVDSALQFISKSAKFRFAS
jgi:DNA-directed RNA polymerase specialized sigma24 family protein